MKIDQAIRILENAKKTLGGDAPVCFSAGSGRNRQIFDFGEHGRENYCLCVTILDTYMHTDPFGMFHIPIRRIKMPRVVNEPMTLKPDPSVEKRMAAAKEWVQEQFTMGCVRKAARQSAHKPAGKAYCHPADLSGGGSPE